MKVTLIGTGFVGVVSAAVYASFGNQVTGLDIDEKKVLSLQKGKVPFFEPGLEELLLEQQKKGNLRFTTSYEEAIRGAEVVILAVGTPSAPDETADLSYIFAATQALAAFVTADTIVAIKSTVPPGTLEKVLSLVEATAGIRVHGASLPEFLREGSAVHDTLHPDRVVIGAEDDFVFQKLEKLHEPLAAPLIHCHVASAQMAKYTANAYLATRITFINEIANLCEKNGADINEVIDAIGYDKRIGKHYWYPGLGYGGSCFPKDVKELAAYSRSIGESGNLLNKINEINKERIYRLMDQFATKIGGFENKTIAVLGLSFKPNTDDMREAPATKVIPYLIHKNAKVKSYDPMANYERFMGKIETAHQQVSSIDEACQSADVIMTLIEWPEINEYDFQKAKDQGSRYFIDCCNHFAPEKMRALGFEFLSIGRG